MNPQPPWTDHRAQLARVTAHIHDRMAGPLDLNELALVAHLSPCHWHRVYPNAQSFTRAFHPAFGQRPQAWRATRTDARP